MGTPYKMKGFSGFGADHNNEMKKKINQDLYGSKEDGLSNVVDPKKELKEKHGGNKPRVDEEGNVIPINPN